jgi:hypothetical protein
MLSFKNMKSRNLAIILKFLYRGTMTAVLPLMVTLIIDHSYYNDHSTPPNGHTYNR